MTKSSRLHAYSFFHILKDVNAAAILFAAALLTSVFTSSALAEDLNGDDKEITAAGPWDVSYTNSNTEQLSTITIGSLNNGTRYTYSGAITGNIAVDITHGAATNNENRFTFSSTGNNFTGGVTMHGGILFITAGNLPTNYSLTLENTVLMSSDVSDFSGSLTIPAGAFAGLRSSGAMTYSGVISGSGDLLITTENGNGVTLSGANTYTGVTSIGTHQGGSTSNSKAYLVLGADNTLPSATVVEIARSQNSNYNYKNSTVANLDLNGTTQTIAGLYGGGVASITNGKAAVANLTINVADSKSYEYSGTIAGNSATNPTNLTVAGAGNQTLSGVISNASVTKEGTGTLTLSAANTYTGNTTISGGTLKLTDSGKVASPAISIADGAKLLYDNTVPKNNASEVTISIAEGGTVEFNMTNTGRSADTAISSGKKITFTGDGTFIKSGTGDLWCQSADNQPVTFALSSKAKMIIEGGIFANGGWLQQTWSGNQAELIIKSGGTLDLWNGTKMEIGGLTGEERSQIICGYADSNGISFGNGVSSSQTYTYSGSINCEQPSMIYKDGAGKQILAGTVSNVAITVNSGILELTAANSSLTNTTTVSGGTLILSGDGTLGTGKIVNNATLEFAHSSNQTINSTISGSGSINKTGTGTLTLSADSISFSNLTVSGGNLDFTPNVKLTASGKISLSDSSSALDLNGADLTYTSNVASDFNNVNITNTNTDKQSVLSFVPSSNLTAAQTFNKKVSGNTRIVVKLPQNQANASRFILSGTNDHTGGLYIEQGTVRVDNLASLGSNKVIDMKHSSLMTNQTFEGYTINLVGDANAGERGAIRISGGSTFAAKVTGPGNFEIVNDGAVTLTNTENDYQGKTYIGNFQWRSDGLNNAATLNLGASGVLPDTTDVVFGKNAEGNGTSGAITLNLQGYDETVSYISGQSTNATITSSTPATLTLIGNNDYTFVGKVTGSATVDKKGTGTLTMTGANTGSLAVSEGTLILSGDNSGAQSIVVGENGTLIPFGTNSAGSEVTMKGGTMIVALPSLTNNASINATEGDSNIVLGLPSGTYARQLFTGTAKDMSNFTKPEFISNMDKIANTAYLPADTATYFTADIWGSTTGDQNNTNLLQTSIVNTTDSPITLDFAYQFHNSAYLAITDSEGNKTVVMNWTNTANYTIDGKIYSYANNTGSFTFEPGETYTIEARLFRFNRTIGANAGGVNDDFDNPVGLGARISGTTGEYLPLNFDGDNWTFSDGSFTFRNQKMSFTSPVSISEGASITFDSPAGDIDISSAVSGAGTLNVNPAEGFTHTYSGSIADTVSIAKSGEGTMALTGNCTSVGAVTVGAGTLDVAFDNVSTELNIGSIAMAENTAFKVTQGTVTFGQTDVVLNNLSGDNGAIVVDGVLTLNNDQLTKYVGAISAQTIKKTGDETLQIYASAEGMVNASSFVVSSGRLDMKDYFTGTLEVGENLGNGSYTTALFSPGNSVGTLTVDGDYSLNPGSTLLLEIGKDDQGNVIADKLIVNGDAAFASGSIIDIVLDNASSLVGGETFEGVIITADNAAEIFDDVKAAIRSYYFTDIQVTQSGNDISLSARLDPNAVPEPSTWALLALGVVVLFLRKRVRN